MSTFAVNVVRIDDVENHPNADRLTLNKIGGYVCISNKLDDGSWRYKPGDLVVYIPEDTVVPEWILRRLDMWDEVKGKGILAGSQGNRLKAIRLRGIFSQGILFPVSDYYAPGSPCSEPRIFRDDGLYTSVEEGQDVAEFLGLTKYEPAVPAVMAGEVVNIGAANTIKYDIEALQKHPNVLRTRDLFVEFNDRFLAQWSEIAEQTNNPPPVTEFIDRQMARVFGPDYRQITELDEEVIFTEKLHGTNMCIGFVGGHMHHPELFFNGMVFAASKGLGAQGLVFKDNEVNRQSNLYVKTLVGLYEGNEQFHTFVDQYVASGGLSFYLFGEVFGSGIQDLAYGQKTPTFRLFDCYLGKPGQGKWLDYDVLVAFAKGTGLELVPLLYRGPFSEEAAVQYRDGKDTISGTHVREGIVIRPTKERTDNRLGRVQLKFVSPDYALRKGVTTEFN